MGRSEEGADPAGHSRVSAQPNTLKVIGRMQRIDLPEVLTIEQASYPFPWSEGVFLDCLRMGYSNWIVRGRSGELLGYTLLAFAADEGHILNLSVSPHSRRQGVGQMLLDQAIAVASRAGIRQMILEVRPSNAAGLGLYARNDFQEIGRRKGYYPAADGREDAIVLARSLRPAPERP